MGIFPWITAMADIAGSIASTQRMHRAKKHDVRGGLYVCFFHHHRKSMQKYKKFRTHASAE